MSTFKKIFLFSAMFAIMAIGFVTSEKVSASDPTVTYTGQGFIIEDGTPNIKDERCGASTDQGAANDGGTGQFANWNGTGMPYETGQPYLVWVLSLNSGKNAVPVTLHLPDGEVDMVKVGGTYKFASQYYPYEDLVNFPVHATFAGNNKNVQLVVSHGCAPFNDTEGAWCSPGYWRNAADAAWALTGYAKTDLFNNTVVPNYYDTASAANPTLIQVLTTPGANTFGSASDPYGLNAFNAVGAFLTGQIPNYHFDPELIGDEEACPIDNHGNYKLPQ